MAYTINHVCLVGGNLTRDAELRYTNNGSALLSFSIAMNRSYKQGETWEERTDFFKVVYWGKPAEAIAKFLTKGKKVAVEGRLSQNRWQSPEGKNMSSVEVVASNVVLMGGKPQGDNQAGGSPDSYPDPMPEQYNQGYQAQQPNQYDGYQQSNYQQPPQAGAGGYGSGYQQGPDMSGGMRDEEVPF